MITKDPIFLPDAFGDKLYGVLRNKLEPIAKTFPYQMERGRYATIDGPDDILNNYARLLLFNARAIFESDTLMPTYSAFCHYESQGDFNPVLIPHKDDNACTYTIDMCVYQTEPWDLIIEGKSYRLEENQAVAFYAEDQKHWRPPFPNPGNQHVAMAFFHYAEPDHWYFTKGRDYIKILRGEPIDS